MYLLVHLQLSELHLFSPHPQIPLLQGFAQAMPKPSKQQGWLNFPCTAFLQYGGWVWFLQGCWFLQSHQMLKVALGRQLRILDLGKYLGNTRKTAYFTVVWSFQAPVQFSGTCTLVNSSAFLENPSCCLAFSLEDVCFLREIFFFQAIQLSLNSKRNPTQNPKCQTSSGCSSAELSAPTYSTNPISLDFIWSSLD